MKKPTIGGNDPCPCGSEKKCKYCCLGKENSTKSSHDATGASGGLRKVLEDRQFNSLQEVQAFLDQHTQQQNRQPLDKFHGLSPELVRFPEVLDTNPTAPILTLFRLLADAIGEQGLKPTAKGNLPRNFCREAALAYWDEKTH